MPSKKKRARPPGSEVPNRSKARRKASKKRAPPPDAHDTGGPGPPKRRRPDVAKRKADAKTVDIVARKVTLKSFCTPEARALHWNDVIMTMNHAAAEGWLLANFVVMHTIENPTGGGVLPPMDNKFFRRCMATVSKKSRPKKSFKAVFQKSKERKVQPDLALEEWKWVDFERAADEYLKHRGGARPLDCKYICLGWFEQAATQMAKNTETSTWKNLARRLRQYVRVKYPEHRADAFLITSWVLDEACNRRHCKSCRTKKRQKKPFPAECQSCDAVNGIVGALREDIPRNQNQKVDWKSTDVLRLFHKYLKAVEEFNETNKDNPKIRQERVYNIIPTKQGFRSSYFSMTSTGLWDLLRRSSDDLDLNMIARTEDGGSISLGDSIKKENWSGVADIWWRKLFRVADLEKGTRLVFHGQICTDGIGASVLLHKPKREPKAEPPLRKIENYDKIKGADPGFTDMFVACTYSVRSQTFSDDFLSYPAKKFYSDSGCSSSNRKIRRKLGHNSEIRKVFKDMPTKKTASLTMLMEYLDYTVPKMVRLFSFFMTKTFRDMRFRRQMLAEKNLRAIRRELAGEPGTRTLIAFGNWELNNSSGIIKKKTPGPVMKLRRMLTDYRGVDVMIVDEYLTSKMHHGCYSLAPMENQQVKHRCRDKVVRTVGVHKVYHCLKRNGGCGATVERDVNASKNMLEVALTQMREGEGVRPERLQRPS
ncbi:hypothetical protein PHYSODRAFT_326769 [Phytophthora sojae]|uniref:Uncharacterized protein n=1 Tax=Phytophthora sojae (strain P6497) TaxID=1094619 RepID=G4YZM2_PHYSP|nr:hypothetical protein PHYSODRAFT_326769 [Phytophthora sojae]EGZ25790.1 hypothetical protein PHYSODRAFT_326769 [Phytophthora sojae]|eukprot:XP_009521078.1 hypothetical protein PHYSODRAFT_326769 [Phytophthora sojae]